MTLFRRLPLLVVLVSLVSQAQAPTATITGRVTDPANAVINGASVNAVNLDTNVGYRTITNSVGQFTMANVVPGSYRLEIAKPGFRTIVRPDIIVHVQDILALNFVLPIGAASEIVTVEGGAPLVNTEDATVSTVIDRRFAENLPMNGRSFQTLILLTPGVVLTHASGPSQGQFSVNGQRDDANYFSVDGVSANLGSNASIGLTQTVGGTTPAWSAQGGTNALVSVDAMQEFRIQTSTFAPEFGRTPGAQVSIVTRSGTNQFHGSLFDYFRNDTLDARDWFVNHTRSPKPAERQNDFGGVLGGPIKKDRSFFFFSYEGMRLRLPRSQTTVVPDSATRSTAAISLQPILNAFPAANGPDFGNGTAQFSSSYSDPSSLDSYSLRIDHAVNSGLTIFGRYSHATSESVTRGLAAPLSSSQSASFMDQTMTIGALYNLSSHVSNDLRLNYSNARAGTTNSLDSFGGATPPGDSQLFPGGFTARNSNFGFIVLNPFLFLPDGKNSTNEQRQLNMVNNVSISVNSHEIKAGIDYRWLAPFSSPRFYTESLLFAGFAGATSTSSGVVTSATISSRRGAALLSRNFSLYLQDTWKPNARAALTYGLRWDVNSALQGKNNTDQPFTIQNLGEPATMTLAPRGTSLYSTAFGNIAPRVGLAYVLHQSPGWETVARGGAGVFYDLGTGSLGNLSLGFPFVANKTIAGVPYPFTALQAAPPAFVTSTPLPAGSDFTVADPQLKLPRTYEWNTALEQSIGGNQTISATYVGAVGRKLLRVDTLFAPNPNFLGTVRVTRNSATSDYHALQMQYRRRFSRGLQIQSAYSWSHSLDIASTDSFFTSTPSLVANPRADRGNSDFDVRHSVTAGVTYDVPAWKIDKALEALTGGWSVDSFFFLRSALPVNASSGLVTINGSQFTARPNVLPGVPLYIFNSQLPGGKAFNRSAFVSPALGQQGDFGRNVLRGFGAWQEDFAAHRQLRISDRFSLQFRAELFNLFNHPNFGDPNNTSITSSLFGQSTQTLATSLSLASAGFSPLYQIGGPRSVQLALKAIF